MNILFLTPRESGKYLGGVERHVRILTKELILRGHQIKELALDEIDGLNKNRLPRAAGGGSRNDEYLFKGRAFRTSIKVTPCSARSHLFKFKAWGYLWKKRELFKWADVIHIHDVFWWVMPLLPMIWFNKYYKSYKGYKNQGGLFITLHGWEGVCPPSRSAVWQKRAAAFFSNGTIGVGSFFEKWYGVTPNKVVFGVLDPNISIALLDSSTALGMTKNSLDCHVPLSGTRNDKPSIVFFGRMEKVNGVEVLLGALDKYYKSYKDYKNQRKKFIFVGEGSYRKQAEKFGKVTGMVKNPQKYLLDADVVITSSYMSMLEAAAMGKPIIAVANSELKEDYLNGHPLREWIRVVRNAEELIDEVKKLKINKDWKERGKRWAEKQTAERLADEYEELWKKYSLSFRT